MKYEKAEGFVVLFDDVDVIATSEECGAQAKQQQYDSAICDGVNQAVAKPF